jgi:hypothetical protein
MSMFGRDDSHDHEFDRHDGDLVEHGQDQAPAEETDRTAATATMDRDHEVGEHPVDEAVADHPATTDEGPEEAETPPAPTTTVDAAPTAADIPEQAVPNAGSEEFHAFERDDLAAFGSRWDAILASFVDDPKRAAEQADALLGDLLNKLRDRHQTLHDELGRRSDQDSDTEFMRLAVRRYRTFFHTLVGS